MLLFLTPCCFGAFRPSPAPCFEQRAGRRQGGHGTEVGKQYRRQLPAVSRSYGTDVRQSSTDASVNESIIIKGMMLRGTARRWDKY